MIVKHSRIGLLALLFFLAIDTYTDAVAADVAVVSNVSSIAKNEGENEKKETAQDNSKNGWGFGTIFLVLGLFGAFGGGLAAFSQVTFSEVIKSGIAAYGSGDRLAGIVTVGSLLGCGGAMAFGFILAVDRKFSSGVFDLDTKVLIAASSISAGFSGIRLLKLVSDKLAEKVQQQDEKIEDQEKVLEGQQQSLQQQTQTLQQQQVELEDQKVKIGQERQIAEALSFAGGILAGC